MKKIRIMSFFIVVFITTPYFLMNKESRELNNITRSSLPGSFIPLSQGTVHYELGGPENGIPVVLVHGLSVPNFVWDSVYSSLVDANYRVLRYDLFGRGLSDRPDVNNNVMLFRDQLKELLDALNIGEKINIVALSMGGAVAIDFANEYPKQVESLSLLAPAGFPVNLPVTAKIARSPIIGTYLMSVFGSISWQAAATKAFYNQDKVSVFWDEFQQQLSYKGFNRSIISTLRHYPLESMHDIYESVGKKNIPTLLLWGKEDAVIPFRNNEKVRQAIPHTQFYGFNDAGHALSFEVPEKVMPKILEFLPKSFKE